MDVDKCINVAKILFTGIGVSLKIFIVTLIFAIPLGIIVALARNSKCKTLSGITKLYILIIYVLYLHHKQI